MEVVKDILMDFILFSLIEAFIFCLFFEKVGGCRKAEWVEDIIPLAITNCLYSQILPPLIYQFISMITMILILKFRHNMYLRKSFMIVFLSITLMLIIEMFYNIFIILFFDKDCFNINLFQLFLFIIPIKIIEIMILKKWGDKMKKFWLGEIKKPVKQK